jgi:uncharacterized HAD superfamily protein
MVRGLSHKLRLGLDLDGVIYRFTDTANYLILAHHGVKLGEWTTWDYPEQNVTKEVWDWLWTKAITDHGLFRYGSLYKGTREFLTEIGAFANIVVITSRPSAAVSDTLEWLAYQKLPTSEVHILGEQKKSSVQPECDVYIDDAIHNCQDLIENTNGLVIMPDRPWNQGYVSEEVTRFHRAFSVAHMKFILETYYTQKERDEQRTEAFKVG